MLVWSYRANWFISTPCESRELPSTRERRRHPRVLLQERGKGEKGGPPSKQTQHAAGAISGAGPDNTEEEALAPRVGELSTAGCIRDRKECGGAEQLPLQRLPP